ncbi:MAG: serine protease AprX, partial [Pyrinomonadaceae bacterium]|nr:serine protease AprX [Pyrinomonadaceae bacterium]
MNKGNYRLRLRRAAALALLLAMCAGLGLIRHVPGGFAKENNIEAKAGKISPEIKSLDKDFKADAILQLNGAMSPALSDFINKNLSLKETFGYFETYAVKGKVSVLMELASFPEVSSVTIDKKVKKLGHVSLTTGAQAARALGGSQPYSGAGVGVAVLDSGVDTTHQSFLDTKAQKISFSKDFTGEGRTDDPFGHGTHVASSIVGGNHINRGAYGGIAPKAALVNLRVLDSQGVGSISSVLRGLMWVASNRATYKIRVVNMSLGGVAVDSYKKDPLCRAVRRLVNSGTVVIAAAGNSGKNLDGNKVYGAVHTPGIEPSAITVGATNTFGTDSRSDDAVTSYSSRGPTRSYWLDDDQIRHYDNVLKPNLVAPGNRLVWAQAKNNYIVTNHPELAVNVPGAEMMYLSGTSMAAPLVSGTVALMLQANPKLTPNLVRMILEYTAQPLPGHNVVEQGAGQLNVEGAVRLARSVRTDLNSATPVGEALLTNNATPEPYTTLGSETFGWSQRFLADPAYIISGYNLIGKYQRIYDEGACVSDGIMVSDGTIGVDGIMVSDGIMV